MKRCAIILLMMTCVSAFAQMPIRIFSTYTEYDASLQLKNFLEKGGCQTAFGGKNSGRTIYVGLAHDMQAKYQPLIDSLHDDGYFIYGNGRDVVLYGAGEKGTLYAVYAFLEMLGYRLYTPTAMVIPDLSDLQLPKCHIVSNPAFAYREVSYYYPNHSQLYADWHHLHTMADRNNMFGMFVHTFKDLIPPARYFDAHPEWFSLNNGRRSRDGQLCLSNPAVLEELCHRLTDTMATAPEKKLWSVSNNDNYNACQCPECLRMDSLYGGPTGTLLHFVNQVARRFPDKTISTLAYQYTRCAPTNPVMKPEKNVNIMFCSIECGRELPIADNPHEASFRKDMDEWVQMTDDIFMWDYVVQFRNFWNPFPNLHVLQPNLQFFHKNGVRMMFEQATGADNKTSWMDIRCYMIAKLLWDVDANIDSIMADFYQGYYGDAGNYVKEIIDTMTATLIASDQRLDIYGYPIDGAAGYLSAKQMTKYDSIMRLAYDVCGNRPNLRSRLRYFQLALDFSTVELQAMEYLPATRESIIERLNSMVATMAGPLGYDIPQLMEMGISPAEYRTTMMRFIDKNFGDRPHYPVTLRHQPTAPYTCDGAATLTDGKGGIIDYRHRWLGFWGDTLDVIIELGPNPMRINEISADFYCYPLSWIFLPDSIEYLASNDGVHWNHLLTDHPWPVASYMLAIPQIFTSDYQHEQWGRGGLGTPVRARYVRVIAYPPPKIPAWHRAAGQRPWIFTDEIIVK